jgi:hypothetical protein
MGSCCGGDAPTPPNPIATAAAQTGTNVSTAVANAELSHVNQVTPTGSLDYSQRGTFSWTDPTTGSTYQIPQYTATQTPTDAQKAIQLQNEGAQKNLATLANTQSGSIGGILNNPFDINSSQVPAAGDTSRITNLPDAATTFGGAGTQQGTFDDTGDITRSFGPSDNFSADRARVEDALFGRLSPQLDRDRSRLEQQLADQGIRYGSPAYQQAMSDFNRQSTDARLAVTAQGGQEQQRMFQMAQGQAQFQNAAEQQAYQEAQGRGTFANAAEAANYQQALGRSTFANAGQQQNAQNAQAALNAENARRANYLQEQFAGRQEPINEIGALLSGSQVSKPNFITPPQTSIPTTDVAGLINTNFNQQFQNYNSQQQATSQLLGGLLGLGSNVGAAYLNPKTSDRRVKENISKMGTVFAAGDVDSDERKKLPIYEYSYKDDPASTRHVGPMAQDVEKVDPGAVGTDRRGIKYIYPRRVMGSIMRAS